jgi:hypothetical protein
VPRASDLPDALAVVVVGVVAGTLTRQPNAELRFDWDVQVGRFRMPLNRAGQAGRRNTGNDPGFERGIRRFDSLPTRMVGARGPAPTLYG